MRILIGLCAVLGVYALYSFAMFKLENLEDEPEDDPTDKEGA